VVPLQSDVWVWVLVRVVRHKVPLLAVLGVGICGVVEEGRHHSPSCHHGVHLDDDHDDDAAV